MSFMGKIAKLFGLIKVKTVGNQVRVTGIDALIMRKYIRKIFETDIISKTMFTSIGETSFSFHQFFIPDIIYVLTKVRMDPKTKWSVRNSIDKIMHGFMTETWYKSTVGEIKPMIDQKRMNVLKWPPLPKQEEFLHLYGDRMPRYDLRGYILALGPGGGKATRLDSLLRTPSGWMKMGDAKIGDTLVMPDGTTAFINGVYPQGKKEIYRVYFEDGRWVDCCDEHLWKVYNGSTKGPNGRRQGTWSILTLREIMELKKFRSKTGRLYIPLPEPEIKEDVDLPIDPYVLGVILGDGTIGKKGISISKPDNWLREEVGRLLPEGYKVSEYYSGGVSFGINYSNTEKVPQFAKLIHDLGLEGTLSYTKFIPDIYFEASYQQKLNLIQGLLDTDGYVGEHCSIQYCTTSEKMAYQFQELIRSIGGLCKLKVKIPHYTHNGERRQGRPAYVLQIRVKDPRTLFRMPRKRDRLSENYQYTNTLRLRIANIEYVGEHEAQCISVDHPDHLYITDDYIVTHNTFTDLLVASCVIPPSVAEVKIIISPKKALHLVWEDSIQKLFKKPPTYWCSDSGIEMPLKNTEYYVFNFESIPKAIELAKKLSAKNTRYFIIVDESHNFADPKSNRTQSLVNLHTIRNDTYFIWTSGTPILKLGTELIAFLKCADPRFDAEAERRFKKIFSSSKGRANEIFNHRLGQMMAFLVPKSQLSDSKPTIKELPIRLPPALAHKFLMKTVREDMRVFIEDRIKFYQKDMGNLKQTVNHWLEYHKSNLSTKEEERQFSVYLKNLKIITKNPDLMLPEILEQTRRYERMYLLPSLPPVERKAFRSALSAIKNIKLKVRGEALGKVLSRRRSEATAALALYCKPEEIIKDSLSKTLFFASSVYPVETLARHLEKKGFHPARVFGDSNKDLTKIINQFHEDPNLNPICATMQSLSEAVPVTAASTVVLLNRPFREATYSQVVSRADRMGQKYPVTVIEPTLDTGNEPNVSSRTDEILAEVRGLINELVGEEFAGPKMEDREYLDLINAAEEDPILQQADELMGLI